MCAGAIDISETTGGHLAFSVFVEGVQYHYHHQTSSPRSIVADYSPRWSVDANNNAVNNNKMTSVDSGLKCFFQCTVIKE